MIQYLIDNRLINPMSKDLFIECEKVLGFFNNTIYIEEINEVLDNTYEGDSIQSEVLSIFDSNITNTLHNLGIFVNEDCSLSKQVDILNAITVIENIDEGLKEDMLDGLNDEDLIDAVQNVISEYFLIITEDLHFLIDHVSPVFIEIMKEFLSVDTDTEHSLYLSYEINKKKHAILDKYTLTEINKMYLNTIAHIDVTDSIIVNMFRAQGLTIDEWSIRTVIAITFAETDMESILNRLLYIIPEEYEERIRAYAVGEFNA